MNTKSLTSNCLNDTWQWQVSYLSVWCSRTPSLLQLILGGGKPSAGQSMVTDRVALVRRALCPMLMLMFFWKVNGGVFCRLVITGLLTNNSPEERSDQLDSSSVGQTRYKDNTRNKRLKIETSSVVIIAVVILLWGGKVGLTQLMWMVYYSVSVSLMHSWL